MGAQSESGFRQGNTSLARSQLTLSSGMQSRRCCCFFVAGAAAQRITGLPRTTGSGVFSRSTHACTGDAPLSPSASLPVRPCPKFYAFVRAAYKNLAPKTRLGLGVGVMAWAVVGLYLSDRAEERFGYTPSEKDKEELWKWAPKVTAVDKSPDK
ncbi:hypothetical protein AAL_01619 [Moelleriella libera RCEF 2490]|uniref:Uncharacterized protein n=1 Tax=Moelleriella libera RCEF 2490 TaxID=1081109 RepID=A0A166UAY9_9HYPO|nr:hypothetical protein AAL_01619 [Moelleriella libera RCEF 2490]